MVTVFIDIVPVYLLLTLNRSLTAWKLPRRQIQADIIYNNTMIKMHEVFKVNKKPPE